VNHSTSRGLDLIVCVALYKEIWAHVSSYEMASIGAGLSTCVMWTQSELVVEHSAMQDEVIGSSGTCFVFFVFLDSINVRLGVQNPT
jgi:hypothetical protein